MTWTGDTGTWSSTYTSALTTREVGGSVGGLQREEGRGRGGGASTPEAGKESTEEQERLFVRHNGSCDKNRVRVEAKASSQVVPSL